MVILTVTESQLHNGSDPNNPFIEGFLVLGLQASVDV